MRAKEENKERRWLQHVTVVRRTQARRRTTICVYLTHGRVQRTKEKISRALQRNFVMSRDCLMGEAWRGMGDMYSSSTLETTRPSSRLLLSVEGFCSLFTCKVVPGHIAFSIAYKDRSSYASRSEIAWSSSLPSARHRPARFASLRCGDPRALSWLILRACAGPL